MTAWDISTAVFSNSFSVNTQEPSPTSLFFKPDGTKMYVIGDAIDRVWEYNLSTPWDITTATVFQSFLVSSQTANPTGLFFRSDGLKMYVTGNDATDRVYEYNLSTAWNIATTTFLQSKDVNAQDNQIHGVFFKIDGLKMYTIGRQNKRIYEYNLSTAWNVSTATFLQSKDVSAQDSFPSSLFIRADGLKMFTTGASNDDAHEYNLSTAWNITTATFVQSLSLDPANVFSDGIFFKDDGLIMYHVDGSLHRVYQYSLALPPCVAPCMFADDISTNTGWILVNTAGAILIDDPLYPDLIKLLNLPNGGGAQARYAYKDIVTPISGDVKLEFKVDYEVRNGTLSAPISIGFGQSTVHPQQQSNYIRVDFNVSIEGWLVMNGIVSDGATTKVTSSGAKNQHSLWVYPNTGDPVSDNSLKGPYYVSVELKNNKLRLSAYKDSNRTQHIRGSPMTVDAIGVNPTNLRYMQIGNGFSGSVSRLFTGTIDDLKISVGIPLESIPQKPLPATGSFIETWEGYVTGDQNPTPWISKTEVSQGWDVSTAILSSFKALAEDSAVRDVEISPDGTKTYMIGDTTKRIYQYTLTIPYDVSTAILLQSISVAPLTFPQCGGMFLRPDGAKLFIGFSGDDNVYEYNLLTPFDISTLVFVQTKCVRLDGLCSGVNGFGLGDVTFSPDGIRMYIGVFTQPADQIMQWSLSTPWNISTATYIRTFGLTKPATGLFFKPDGTKMFVMSDFDDKVDAYDLSIPWDISTATFLNFFAGAGGLVVGLSFRSDGLKMYWSNVNNIFVYDLPVGIIPLIDIHEVSTSAPLEGAKAFKLHQKYHRTTGFPFGKVSVSRFVTAIVRTDGSGLDLPISLSGKMKASILSSLSDPVGIMVGYEFILGTPTFTSQRGILFKLYGTAGTTDYIWNGTEFISNHASDTPISLTTPVNTIAEINSIDLKNTLNNSAILSNVIGTDFESHVIGMFIGYVGLNRATSSVDTEVLINGDTMSLLNIGVGIKTFSVGAITEGSRETTFKVDALLRGRRSFTIDALLPPTPRQITIDARIVRRTAVNSAIADAILFGSVVITTQTKTFTVDAQIKQPLYKTFSIDAKLIKKKQKSITIDGIITPKRTKITKIDAIIVGGGEPQSILDVESVIGHDI